MLVCLLALLDCRRRSKDRTRHHFRAYSTDSAESASHIEAAGTLSSIGPLLPRPGLLFLDLLLLEETKAEGVEQPLLPESP